MTLTLTLNLTPTPDPTPTATPTPEPTQVHLRIKEVTEYTGPETYVRDMLAKNDFGFFPILKTSSIIVEDVSNEVLQHPNPNQDPNPNPSPHQATKCCRTLPCIPPSPLP